MWGKNTSVARLSSWIEKAGQAVWWYQMVQSSADESEAEKNRDGDADCELENTQGWSGETFRWVSSGGLGLCIGDRKLKLVRNSKTQVGANLPVWWSTIWQRITALTWLLSTEPPDGQWFAGVREWGQESSSAQRQMQQSSCPIPPGEEKRKKPQQASPRSWHMRCMDKSICRTVLEFRCFLSHCYMFMKSCTEPWGLPLQTSLKKWVILKSTVNSVILL